MVYVKWWKMECRLGGGRHPGLDPGSFSRLGGGLRWDAEIRETAARDTGFHESGHVVHDQICGALNGQTFLRKNIDINETDRLRKKSEDLFKKYEKSSDLSWLSKYGMINFYEFFAEGFVLYMCKPESLPADVRQMFEDVERLANPTK